MAYFNENDEMVITKVEKNENPKALPAGCVKIQRGQTMNYKVEKDQMGEKFIENLERSSTRRRRILLPVHRWRIWVTTGLRRFSTRTAPGT